jgi:hypothetical protein
MICFGACKWGTGGKEGCLLHSPAKKRGEFKRLGFEIYQRLGVFSKN